MRLGVGLHIDVDDVVLGAGAGRPDLLPGNHVFIAVAPRLRAHGADIGAGIRLGHGNRHADFAGNQFRQPVALLFLGAFAGDVERAKNAAAEGHRHVGAVAADFLGDDGEINDAAAEAAIFLGEGQSEQPGLHPGVIELVRIKPLSVEPAQIVGRCHPLHQLAHAFQELLLLGRILEIHASSRAGFFRDALLRYTMPYLKRLA